jgi:hypothetical protein
MIGATGVRVFFRLFQSQTTSGAFDYPPGAQYRRAASNPHGQPIALAGILGGEYVTVPCFATARVNSTATSMADQIDDPNVQNFRPGTEVDRIFGCWLDINQPFTPDGVTPNNRLPAVVPATNVDGPFTNPGNPPRPIQQAILRSLHQCLIAEIAFDPVAIPPGKDASNWDKLAQRNLAWSDAGSATAVSTFEVRPTQWGMPAGQPVDELMIDWGTTPKGCIASLYLPAADADEILALAGRMYTSRHLTRADDHTLQCKTGGITYVPIPVGRNSNHAGLLTVDLPSSLRPGHVGDIVVRQVTNAFSKGVPPARSIRRAGKKDPVCHRPAVPRLAPRVGCVPAQYCGKAEDQLLLRGRDFSDGGGSEGDPQPQPVASAFQSLSGIIAGRVKEFGGDPMTIQPSPTGDGKTGGHPGRPGGYQEGVRHREGR